ncbi:MAG: hypothetical protein CVU47_01250 [Chloroflexi bacterium HGW-Chloroflexi-9]|nr:MAG: hypothetical protein CVU47_01250 [Chloroflexi bacterium HGW-Chloroflexi-9]
MPRLWVSYLLFLSSYAPLLLLLALRTYERPSLALVFATAGLLSIAVLAIYLHVIRRAASIPLPIERMTDRTGDIAGYLTAYLFQFLLVSGNLDDIDLLSLLLMFVLLAVISVRAHFLYVNPILSVLGYRLFEVESGGGLPLLLISRREPSAGTVLVHDFGHRIFLEAEV